MQSSLGNFCYSYVGEAAIEGCEKQPVSTAGMQGPESDNHANDQGLGLIGLGVSTLAHYTFDFAPLPEHGLCLFRGPMNRYPQHWLRVGALDGSVEDGCSHVCSPHGSMYLINFTLP